MSLYQSVQDQLRNSYAYLSDRYVSSLLEPLLTPHKIIEVNLSIQMDDGSIKTFVGYRSQHNNLKGPYKGGIRFHQDVSKDEVMSLSAWMTIKTSVVGLPLGGGKGGVIVDPKQLSKSELERLSRAYMRALAPHVGKDLDVPAPDVNTDSQIMAWMADEYHRVTGRREPGVITGKPLALGGAQGRDIATSLGGLYVLQTYLTAKDQSLIGKKIIVQGSGNAGLNFALLAHKEGAIIVGISDSSAGLYHAEGLDILDLEYQKNTLNKRFDQLSGSFEKTSNADLLTRACDILVPAALEGQITDENVGKIQAGLILELANGPTTQSATMSLYQRGIDILPDILANAGGVTVSYFEQVQNNTNYYRSREETFEKLETIMISATDRVLDAAQKHQVDMRTAAYIVALDRLLEASSYLA